MSTSPGRVEDAPDQSGSEKRFRTTFLLTAVWTVNLVLVAITIWGFFASDAAYDWLIYSEAGRRIGGTNLYVWNGQYTWNYSPLLAYLFALLIPIGYVGWSLLHVLALAALRDKWLIGITALSWPFWADLYNGNTMVFVFVAAATALRGSALATAAYFTLCLVMPRPIMLPLRIWLLWKRPVWRPRFAGILTLNILLVLASGYGPAWIETLLGVSDAVAASARDVGPGSVLGLWWIPVGAVSAIILTKYGHIGLASMAASPYWLPQYLLMSLLELVRHRSNTRRDGEAHNVVSIKAP